MKEGRKGEGEAKKELEGLSETLRYENMNIQGVEMHVWDRVNFFFSNRGAVCCHSAEIEHLKLLR